MRRRKLKHKKTKINTLFLLFFTSLCIVGVGYSLLSESLQLKGTATLANQTNPEADIDFTYKKNIWGSSPYTIQFDISIKNKSTEIKNGWYIYIDVPDDTEVVSCWGVKCSIKDGKLILENVDYNSNIGIDGQLSFGIQINASDSNLELSNPYFESKKEEMGTPTVTEELTFTYNQTNTWQDEAGIYIEYNAIVKNVSNNTLENWRVELAKEGNIQLESAWNANYIEQDSCIIFSNLAYNGTLESQSSISFGFVVLLGENTNNQINSLKLKNLYVTR